MLPLPSSPHRKELLAPKAFATLPSRVFGMSGIPAATESSCSLILQQVLRMEVPLPLHCQVPASLHQPCAEAFPASSRALPSSRELGTHRDGGVQTRSKLLLWLLDPKVILSRQGDIG